MVQKTHFPPLTANHRHFFGMGSRQKPIVLMVFLPTGFWVNVLFGKDLSGKNYRKKSGPHLKKHDFRQPPPSTAIF
jgi:hypothetical protein